MKNIRQITYRKSAYELTAGVAKRIDFIDTKPNHFIINSSINDILYVGDTPNLSSLTYSRKLAGVSRQVYAEIVGTNYIYLLSDSGGTVVLESYFSEFTENSIFPTVETLTNIEELGTPKAYQINLVGGVLFTVKSEPGWICSFGAGNYESTQIFNGTTVVWSGDYWGEPFYNDTNIKILCASNNTVNIVRV